MKFDVTHTGRLIVEPESPEEIFDSEVEIESAFTETMRELVKLGVEDPSVTGSAATGYLEVSLVAEAGSPLEAATAAAATIRSALHAAHVNTEDWDKGRLRVEWLRVEAGDEAEDAGKTEPAPGDPVGV